MRAPAFPLRSVLLTLSLCLLVFAVDSSKLPNSVTLSYELLSDPSKVKPLCTVFYDPQTRAYHVSSWTPPSIDSLKSTSTAPQSSPLLRILLPNGSSSVTSLSTFAPELRQKIDLWLSDSDSSIFSAAITSLNPPPLTPEEERLRKKIERAKARGKPLPTLPKPKKPKKNKKNDNAQSKQPINPLDENPVYINLISAAPGPVPRLNSRAPPQVDEQGNEIVQPEQQEKTFFQKYWWIFAAVAVLTMTAGGGDK